MLEDDIARRAGVTREVWDLSQILADHLWAGEYVPGIGNTGEYVIDPRNLAQIILNAGYVLPTPPANDVREALDLDALKTGANAQITAIDQMDEVGRGVGGMTRPNLAAYMAWQDASDGYDHADTVLALIERLRAAEALSTPPADDVREAAEAAAEAKYPTGVSTMGWSYEDAAEYDGRHKGFIEGFLAAAEVRPRGTVTDHPATYDGNLRCAFCGKIMGLEGRGSSSERWVHL